MSGTAFSDAWPTLRELRGEPATCLTQQRNDRSLAGMRQILPPVMETAAGRKRMGLSVEGMTFLRPGGLPGLRLDGG
jgi:hypothetical protein